MKKTLKRIVLVLVLLAVVAAIVIAFLPGPVPVDLAMVERGPLVVTVDEDGRTRLKDRYIVSAPLEGRLLRIEHKAGDPIVAGESILAVIEPRDPSLLDPRARAEAESRVRAAEAAAQKSQPEVERTEALLELAERQLSQLREANTRGAATADELLNAETLARTRREEHRAAIYAQDIAQYELQVAQAALLRTRTNDAGHPTGEIDTRFLVLAPISGRVLRVIQESAGVVQPGEPLLEVGDPAELELEVDVLSRDAVRIKPGARVILDRWGGDAPLRGQVRLVEPSGFTKVSALGVEEQRVNVIIDFIDPPAAWRALGDGYRVEARIVVWESDDTLQVPVSALFRASGPADEPDDRWAVYLLEGDRAVQREAVVGRMNGVHAEIVSGLREGDRVVLYPSDRVAPGAKLRPRGS